jgi:hypothetical protein
MNADVLVGTPFKTTEEYDEAMREAFSAQDMSSPFCHMKPMVFECSDEEYSNQSWWQCEHCGHTKDIDWSKENDNQI